MNKKISHLQFPIFIAIIVLAVCAAFPATAMAQTNPTGQTTEISIFAQIGNGELQEIPVTSMRTQSRSISEYNGSQKAGTPILYVETYSVLIEVTVAGKVRVIDSLPVALASTVGAGETDNYWRADITISYEWNGTTGRLISTSGGWYAQRQTSTVTGRHVYYAQGPAGYANDKYPSSNTWSYNTGYPTMKLMDVGCNSTITYINMTGATSTLTCNAYKSLI